MPERIALILGFLPGWEGLAIHTAVKTLEVPDEPGSRGIPEGEVCVVRPDGLITCTAGTCIHPWLRRARGVESDFHVRRVKGEARVA